MRAYQVAVAAVSVLVLTILALAEVRAGDIPHHGISADPEGKAVHCLSCHDGVQSKYAAVCIGKCVNNADHPILKPYPPPGKAEKFYSLPEVKARGIPFESDRITCISCHDIRRNKPAHPRDSRGEICLNCHKY